MPSISSGGNATFTVPSGYVIDVQCPGGWIQVEYPVGTKAFEGNVGAGRSFGPYTGGGQAKLTSVKGDIYYEVDAREAQDTNYDPSNVAITGGTIDGGSVAVTQKLRKWRAAVARARAGGAPARLALVGDSTTRGSGSNGSLTGGNLASKAYPAALATMLTRSLAQAQANSFFGWGGNPSLTADDTRVSMTGGWALNSIKSVGANVIQTSTTGVLTFTPTANCKTFDVYYLANSGLGTFNIDVGGVGATPVNSATTSGTIQKATITAGSSSLSPLNITWVSGGCYIVGVEGRDTADLISVWNMGWASSKVSDWNDAANPLWRPTVTLPQLSPDLTVICLTINDWIAATSVTSYTSDLQAIITAALSAGDCILMTGVPSNTANASASTQAIYNAINQSLATANGIPLIDMAYRWGDYATSNALGMYFDNVHPKATGYTDMAAAVQRLIGYL